MVLLLDGVYELDQLIMQLHHLRVLFVSEADDGIADIAERGDELRVGKGVQIDGVNVDLFVVFHAFIISNLQYKNNIKHVIYRNFLFK